MIGGYLFIRLIGKVTTQQADELYYIAIRNITAWGMPIGLIKSKIIQKSILQYCCYSHDNLINEIKEKLSISIYTNDEQEEEEEAIISPMQVDDNQISDQFLEEILNNFIFEMNGVEGYGRIIENQNKQIEKLAEQGEIVNLFLFLHNDFEGRNLRTKESLDIIKNIGGIELLEGYFNFVIHRSKLNEEESIYLICLCIESGKNVKYEQLFHRAFLRRKIHHSRAVGDFARKIDLSFALEIYLGAHCFTSLIDVCAELGRFSIIINIWRSERSRDHIITTIRKIKEFWGDETFFKFSYHVCVLDPVIGPDAVNAVLHLTDNVTFEQIIRIIDDKLRDENTQGTDHLILRDKKM